MFCCVRMLLELVYSSGEVLYPFERALISEIKTTWTTVFKFLLIDLLSISCVLNGTGKYLY